MTLPPQPSRLRHSRTTPHMAVQLGRESERQDGMAPYDWLRHASGSWMVRAGDAMREVRCMPNASPPCFQNIGTRAREIGRRTTIAAAGIPPGSVPVHAGAPMGMARNRIRRAACWEAVCTCTDSFSKIRYGSRFTICNSLENRIRLGTARHSQQPGPRRACRNRRLDTAEHPVRLNRVAKPHAP
jgi:hypothetical protein